MTWHPVIHVTTPFIHKAHFRLRKRLPMWVVYRPVTREYPGRWVARLHVTLPEQRASRFVATHYSLDELRAMLPPGLVRMARDPNDVPEIEEVWI